jgi:type I restriction enzyme M protein
MRMLAHYHAYGDATKVPSLVAHHSGRIRGQITQHEHEEVQRLEAEYQEVAEKLAKLDNDIRVLKADREAAATKAEAKAIERKIEQLERQYARFAAKIAERDERLAEARHRAEDDWQEVIKVGEELAALYGDSDELLKHARVVGLDEIVENEFNLNIPRYVDTFEPEPRVEVTEALKSLEAAESNVRQAETNLRQLIQTLGYDAKT